MEQPKEAKLEKVRPKVEENLEDANGAGTENSQRCTLILTDGHAAKSLALAGVSEIPNGRDRYGVYPLERQVINVSKKKITEVQENEAVLELVIILGLQFNKRYETEKDFRTLRYGHVMLMMNRDEDGSHKKGLLMNIFRCHWPDLFSNGFIQQFITPVVTISDRKGPRSFYSYQKFKRYCSVNHSFEDYPTIHHRSLESFTSFQIKQFFSQMDVHCVQFSYNGKEDNDSFNISFGKGCENERKKWLKESQEPLLYSTGMEAIASKDFINKELKFYSKLHNVRSFRSVIDGLTRSERNILRACFEKWDNQEVNVLTVIHSVWEDLTFKQSIDSLGQTIIKMAQDFVGRNNINILMPLGQFGTRLRGGDDAGKVENLRTKLQDFSELLFSVSDNTPHKNNKWMDISMEPFNYYPIIPMILVNGSTGIGTGFKTNILSYNPEDIIENIHRLMEGKNQNEMTPWFRGFRGEVEKRKGENEYRIYGDVSEPEGDQISITELPIRVWTEDYKRNTLNPMLNSKRILNYKEYHTDTSVHFRVTLDKIPENFEKKKILESFNLYTDITETLVAFDIGNSEKIYGSVTEILKEFYDVRLDEYESTRQDKIAKLKDRLSDLITKRRKLHQEIIIENPVKSEKITIKREYLYTEDNVKVEEESPNVGSFSENSVFSSNIWCNMERQINEMDSRIRILRIKLLELEESSVKELWRKDLEELCLKLGIRHITIKSEDDEANQESNTSHSMNIPHSYSSASTIRVTNASNSKRGPKTSTPKKAAAKGLSKSSKGRQKDKESKNSESCESENNEHNISEDDDSKSEDIRNELKKLNLSQK